MTRIVACGQTMAHLLHWMQTGWSHTGISSAMFRFSHCAVPVGYVPSTGILLTGIRSPNPPMISAVTSFTNAGAFGDTRGGMAIVLVTLAGTFTSKRFASV